MGSGGFGREALVCLLDTFAVNNRDHTDQIVFMVDDAFYSDTYIMGIPVIKRSEFKPQNYRVSVAIGDPVKRKNAVEALPKNTIFESIIHPSAIISKWVEIGQGSIIAAGVIATCGIKIGAHAHLNLNTTIGHDCKIGTFFTTAPATNISGNCTFGDCVYFGTNSSARDNIKICQNVTIGMGGVVVKDITERGVYIGNPLRKLSI